MLGDFFSKPLQGGLFKYFRDIIMGYAPTPEIPDPTLISSAPEERVGEQGAGDQSDESTAMEKKDDSGDPTSPRKRVSWADIVRRDARNFSKG